MNLEQPENFQPKVFKGVDGDEVTAGQTQSLEGYAVGDLLRVVNRENMTPGEDLVPDVLQAQKLEIVGFTDDGYAIIQMDHGSVVTSKPGEISEWFGEYAEPTMFLSVEDTPLKSTGEAEKFGFTVGEKLKVAKYAEVIPEVESAKELKVIGFTANEVIIQIDGDKVVATEPKGEDGVNDLFDRA